MQHSVFEIWSEGVWHPILRDDGKTPVYLVLCWSGESNPSRPVPIALLFVRGSVERVSIHVSNRHTHIYTQPPCPYLPRTTGAGGCGGRLV